MTILIPGVRYVVDAGREKRRVYGDEATGGGGGGAASAGLSRFTVGLYELNEFDPFSTAPGFNP
jgi:hypothetical protein